jgi:hypothetical protein
MPKRGQPNVDSGHGTAGRPERTKRLVTESNKADPEQYQRFLEAARELGCDESEEALERAVRAVAHPRQSSAETDYIREVEYKMTPDGIKFIGSRIISSGSE